MNSCVNSLLWRALWNHGWIPGKEHIKWWLNSLILKYYWFSPKFISVRENVLLFQSNCHSFFAVSSLQALRAKAAARWLPGGAAATAKDRCCTQQGREDMEGLVSTWKTSLEARSAGPACQHETFKLRDYQRDQPQGYNPEGALRSFRKSNSSRRRHMIII